MVVFQPAMLVYQRVVVRNFTPFLGLGCFCHPGCLGVDPRMVLKCCQWWIRLQLVMKANKARNHGMLVFWWCFFVFCPRDPWFWVRFAWLLEDFWDLQFTICFLDTSCGYMAVFSSNAQGTRCLFLKAMWPGLEFVANSSQIMRVTGDEKFVLKMEFFNLWCQLCLRTFLRI